jgi:hypothetical protein
MFHYGGLYVVQWILLSCDDQKIELLAIVNGE